MTFTPICLHTLSWKHRAVFSPGHSVFFHSIVCFIMLSSTFIMTSIYCRNSHNVSDPNARASVDNSLISDGWPTCACANRNSITFGTVKMSTGSVPQDVGFFIGVLFCIIATSQGKCYKYIKHKLLTLFNFGCMLMMEMIQWNPKWVKSENDMVTMIIAFTFWCWIKDDNTF